MKHNLKNNKGNILVLVCASLPVFISMLGICIDGGLVVYYQTKLNAATKFAALSASSHYTINEGNIIINANETDVTTALSANFKEAQLKSFSIDDSAKNKCTVVAQAKVDFVFMSIFGINNKIISESYTVVRS